MSRAGQILRGLAALVSLVTLVIGVPWALVAYVGWPLPHALPTWSQFTTALTQNGIPDRVIVDTLAVVVWITWATMVASLVAELTAAARGRNAARLRALGPLQPMVASLLAAVIVGAVATLAQPAAHAPAVPLAATLTFDPPSPAFDVPTLATANGFFPLDDEPVPASEPVEPTTREYVVRRGDTLWGIAARQLGDPLRWRDIYDLNRARPQPGGRTLDDPHWIDPGWTLLLSAEQSATSPPAPPSSAPPAPILRQPSISPTPPVEQPTLPHHERDAGEAQSPSAWVALESGSRIGAAFAAGVLAAIATGRLRRRRHYRPSPVSAGPPAGDGPWPSGRGALRDLLVALHDGADDEYAPLPGHLDPPSPLTTTPDEPARLQPDRIDVGTRDGATLQLRLTDWPGLTLHGPGADLAARAWVAALITGAGPYAANILMPADLAERLLTTVTLPGLHRVEDATAVIARLEAELIGRTRRLENADIADADSYRQHNPEDPLPLLLAVIDELPAAMAARWHTVLQRAPRLGIAALVVQQARAKQGVPNISGSVRVTADSTVEHAHPHELADALQGARLFHLTNRDLTELLGLVAAIHNEAEADTETDAALVGLATEPANTNDDGETRPTNPATGAPTIWPAPRRQANEEAPIQVRLLGPAHIRAWDEPVVSGLRASAYELLAWYLLRPQGATAEAAIDAIWPDAPPERGRQRFWTALGNLRSRLRGPDGHSLDIITKTGEHYRPEPEVLDVDVWHFQSALAATASAADADTAIATLEQAVTAYGSDLCPGADYLWIETEREDLHRRALDAHLRLAELLTEADRTDNAIATLEHATRLDPVCEEAYRRLITLQAEAGRTDAAQRTWHLLRGRLAELDLEPEPETTAVERRVRSPQATTRAT